MVVKENMMIVLTALSVALLVAVLVVGCAPQSTVSDVEDPLDLAPEPEVEAEPEPVPETEPVVEDEPAEDMTEETGSELDYNFDSLPSDEQRKIKLVRKLLDEARGREENYFFRFTGPKTSQTDVWVKGNMMKRQAYRPAELDKFQTWNMVYMDLKTLNAEAFCETSKAKCWEGHGPFDATTSRWKVKTPKDWVLELDDNFRWTLDNKIGDQLYHIIDYVQPDQTVRVYVNDYRGWPYRVEVYPAGTTVESIMTERASEEYLYDDMDIGGVSDDDVTPGL